MWLKKPDKLGIKLNKKRMKHKNLEGAPSCPTKWWAPRGPLTFPFGRQEQGNTFLNLNEFSVTL